MFPKPSLSWASLAEKIHSVLRIVKRSWNAGSDLRTFGWLETHLNVCALSEYIIDTLPLLEDNLSNARKKSRANRVFVNSKWALVTAEVEKNA